MFLGKKTTLSILQNRDYNPSRNDQQYRHESDSDLMELELLDSDPHHNLCPTSIHFRDFLFFEVRLRRGHKLLMKKKNTEARLAFLEVILLSKKVKPSGLVKKEALWEYTCICIEIYMLARPASHTGSSSSVL